MKSNSYDNFFMNFSNKTKFKILMALKEKPLSVSEITEKVKEEQSTVSHNLKKLAHCRIVEVEQKGKQRIYSLNKETVKPILDIMVNHVKKYCVGRSCKK